MAMLELVSAAMIFQDSLIRKFDHGCIFMQVKITCGGGHTELSWRVMGN